MRRITLFLVLLAMGAAPVCADDLDIFFIDVEGGQATLIVSPRGESLLIDAGYGGREGRDPARILAASREARLDRIDYLLVTHFHPDHVGGVPELAAQIPIGTFIDYGAPLGTPFGADRMTTRSFGAYEPVRAGARHLVAAPGERLPLAGIDIDVVSAGGALLSDPLPGAGRSNEACATAEEHPEDGTENFRSVGIRLRFGAFTFLDLGDLSGNTLRGVVCPRDLVGPVSAYLVAHHGEYDTSLGSLYAALQPRVAIMNNGITKGGDPASFKRLRELTGLEDLWQLHESHNTGARNSPSELIANIDADGSTAHWIRLTAREDGSFRIVNSRNGFEKSYAGGPHD